MFSLTIVPSKGNIFLRHKEAPALMRIAHLADVHLGYRAYNRVTRQGINRREADVFNAFRQALAKIAELQPDIIVIAGDLFHVVRPSNLCIEHTFRELMKLRTQTGAPLVLLGGNHDSPRSSDTGCILELFSNVPGTYVIHNDYRGVEIPEVDTTIFGLCHRALPSLANLKIEPNPSSKHNILAVHGMLEGIKAAGYSTVNPITRSQIVNAGWDYIALGHYHIFQSLDTNIYYSGSTEFTSFNIWEEVGRPKGFIEYDLDKRELIKFHELATRDVVDMRPVDGNGLSAAEISTLIMHRIDGVKGGHEDKIIRLIVENVAKPVVPDLDYRSIRQIRSEALHFELTLRTVKPRLVGVVDGSSGDGTVRTLEDEWRSFSSEYEIGGGLDRAELTKLGIEYLEREAER